MSTISLSKEQILNGIVAPFVKALSYALSLIADKALVAEIVADVKNSIDSVNVETPPTQEEAVRALLTIADTVTDATPTEVDDKVVDAASLVTDFIYKRGQGAITLFKLIGMRLKIKKQQKAEENSVNLPG